MGSSKEVLEKINETFKTFSQKTPNRMKGFRELLTEVGAESSLDKKTIELISIACAIVSHCESCIYYHVKGALDADANQEEILDATWVGILMGGAPALMYTPKVLTALEEFTP